MLSIHLPTDRRHRWDGRRQRQGPVTMAHPEDLRTDNIARRTPFLPGTSRPVRRRGADCAHLSSGPIRHVVGAASEACVGAGV